MVLEGRGEGGEEVSGVGNTIVAHPVRVHLREGEDGREGGMVGGRERGTERGGGGGGEVKEQRKRGEGEGEAP